LEWEGVGVLSVCGLKLGFGAAVLVEIENF
jgi:hypothetical protein